MAWWLRAFAVFPEDLGSIPRTHVETYNGPELQFKNLTILWFLYQAHTMCTEGKTFMYII